MSEFLDNARFRARRDALRSKPLLRGSVLLRCFPVAGRRDGRVPPGELRGGQMLEVQEPGLMPLSGVQSYVRVL